MRQYLDVLKEVFEKGEGRPNRTGIHARTIFCPPTMVFDMADGFPAITTKRLAFKQVKAELIFFLSGSQDVKDLQALGCNIWNENAEAPYWKPKAQFEGDLGRIYGVQWRRWKSPWTDVEIDQLAGVIERIKRDPFDRRLVVDAWNPAELDMVSLPWCHMDYQFDVNMKGELSLAMQQRSCDMFLGVPFNIASYALLLHIVAQITGLKPDKFHHRLNNTHIYHNHLDQVKEQLSREPLSLPRLQLSPNIKSLDDFTVNGKFNLAQALQRMEDIKLIGYRPHPPIKGEMAV